MANPHEVAIRAAERTTAGLARLFGQLGTREHPRGRVLVAYRNAHRGLRDAFRQQEGARWRGAQEVLGGLRREVEAAATTALAQAAELGLTQARTEMEAREIEIAQPRIPNLNPPLVAWMTMMDGQLAAVRATIATGTNDTLVLGDETRAGLLHPGSVIREGTRWLTTAAILAWLAWIGQAMRDKEDEWAKQAIPCIDTHTTDCCLQVCGQVVPLSGKFHLTGTPRFADYQDWSGFHWGCRTSVVLVRPDEADDDLTGWLKRDASAEREKRVEVAERVQEIQTELAGLGTAPDGRRRKDDTKAMTRLRQELVALRRR